VKTVPGDALVMISNGAFKSGAQGPAASEEATTVFGVEILSVAFGVDTTAEAVIFKGTTKKNSEPCPNVLRHPT